MDQLKKLSEYLQELYEEQGEYANKPLTVAALVNLINMVLIIDKTRILNAPVVVKPTPRTIPVVNETGWQLIKKAKDYGIKAHSDSNHLIDGKPYTIHLSYVYDYAMKFFHLLPEGDIRFNILAATWVHDVIEDARQTYNDVLKATSKEVADIAYAVTNEKGKTRDERANGKYYEGILSTPGADFVKICDRLANIKYSKENNSHIFNCYKKESEGFYRKLQNPQYTPMFIEMDELLDYTPY